MSSSDSLISLSLAHLCIPSPYYTDLTLYLTYSLLPGVLTGEVDELARAQNPHDVIQIVKDGFHDVLL